MEEAFIREKIKEKKKEIRKAKKNIIVTKNILKKQEKIYRL